MSYTLPPPEGWPWLHSASAARPLAGRVSEAGLMSLGFACNAIGASPFVVVPLLFVLIVAGIDLDSVPIMPVALAVIVGLMAVTFVVVFPACPRERIVAGERVLADAGLADNGVDVHRLSRIELHGGRRHPWLVLTQRDEPGTDDPAPALRASLAGVASNPQLWKVVHRGPWHAVATGAVSDEHTREILGLPPGR